MKRQIYDLFRIPYYRALISKHGEVIATVCVKIKDNVKDFKFKNARFILPNDKDLKIPPLKIKSGRLVSYDVNSAVAMRLVTKREDGIEWMSEETRKEYIVHPQQFYLAPLDVKELSNYLESKTVEDILSDNEKQFPMWIIILIIAVVSIIGLIAAVYMVTHAPPTVITEYLPTITPSPTPYIVEG